MTKRITYFITAIVFLLLVYLVYDLVATQQSRQDLVISKGESITQTLNKDINLTLQEVMDVGTAFAKKLETNSYSKEELEGLIEEESKNLPHILGVTVAYQPYAFNDVTELYAPYYDKKQGAVLEIGSLYDYTDASLNTTKWYTQIRDHGNKWVEPYYAKGAQALVADYGIPFYYKKGVKKGQFKGMVSMTISLKQFTQLIHNLSLGKTGYGFVTSKANRILAHPIDTYVGVTTLNEISEKETKTELKAAYKKSINGNTGYTDYFDEERKQKSLFFYDKISVNDWRIGVLFFSEDLIGKTTDLKQKSIAISIVLSVLLLSLLAIFYNRDYLSVREIWYLSFFATLILLANLFYVGYLQHEQSDVLVLSESPPVYDNATLSSIVNSEKQNRKASLNVVKTGIYIEEIEFHDSYNVNLSGVIWQKYDTSYVNNVAVGFKFPQASPFAESLYIEETNREIIDDYVLVSSQFRITSRMNFDYSYYPFDKRNLNLEIQPLKAKDNLLFIPDLDSYKYTNPRLKNGLSPNVDLSGNDIIETYFSYRFMTYNTNFGYSKASAYSEVPELHFNINLKRVLITSFVTYLIPIFVTLVLIFIMIFSTSKSKDKMVDSGIVQGMAAFFFVLIFSHIDLRKNIDTADLIYMEYFYFVTYIMIILSTFNLITYSRTSNRLFDYENNLIVKATFWPVFLVLVLIITLFKFH